MAPAMAPAVLFRAAVATIGRFPALAGVDLELAPGELAVLEGPNGAGKTSVLRACAGLLALSGGEGLVLGHDVRRQAAAIRGMVGYFGHTPALYDELTVAENLRFSLRAAGTSTTHALDVLDRVGLGGRLARTAAAKLSAGQRRRAALAVVVARRPALWLLDEPHAALDADGRRLVDACVRSAVAGGGAVVLVSHETGPTTATADREVRLHDGRAWPVDA